MSWPVWIYLLIVFFLLGAAFGFWVRDAIARQDEWEQEHEE